MVFNLCVRSKVRAPILAEAHAASVPACPPPTTMTSNLLADLSLALLKNSFLIHMKGLHSGILHLCRENLTTPFFNNLSISGDLIKNNNRTTGRTKSERHVNVNEDFVVKINLHSPYIFFPVKSQVYSLCY